MKALRRRGARRLLALTVALVAFSGSFGPMIQPVSASYFSDIARSSFVTEINWLVDVAVTDGCGNGRYCPTGVVSRGQMAAFLNRALRLANTPTDFFDDDDGTPFEGDINKLAAAGITGGCGTRRYCPNAKLTREQMASFLTRALRLPASRTDFFSDDERSIHEGSINALAAAGVTGGCTASQYCPTDQLRREQMAAFLYRSNRFLHLRPVTSPIGVSQRPYTVASPWNTPIGTSPAIDSNSGRMIATITAELSSDPSQYTFPVYWATSSTPRYTVSCLQIRCTVVSLTGSTTASSLTGVPIPVGATPSDGSDGQMIIIDPMTGREWDLWQASFAGGRWTVSNGSVYNVRWNGTPTRYGSRGAGVPYLAGLIRPWEIQAGHIDHALAFAYPSPRRSECVWPASKTDGQSSNQYAIPEGARLQLDPRYTDTDFTRWGLDRTGRIIARALQKYGMFLIDVSGRPKIYAENLADNTYATRSWSEAAIRLTASTVNGIPVSALRVIRLPSAYWSGSSSSMHGSCVQ